MGNKIKKIKKIRIHHEGTDTLLYGLMGIVAVLTSSLFCAII